MLATPTVAPPVSKLVFAPPALSEMVLCAGQNSLGVHCRTRSLSQVKSPVGTVGEIDDEAALRCRAIGDVPGEGHRDRMRHANRRGDGEMLATSVGRRHPQSR